jgi:hypothetical protein
MEQRRSGGVPIRMVLEHSSSRQANIRRDKAHGAGWRNFIIRRLCHTQEFGRRKNLTSRQSEQSGLSFVFETTA